MATPEHSAGKFTAVNTPALLIVILVLALAVRLYHIAFPVAGFAAWRQADTAAVAKNFYENGFHITRPQIDWGGTSAGYVEMEFPLYSFLISLLYALFTPNDMWGRLLSVLCSIGAVTSLFFLVRKVLGETTALWTAAVYAFLPLNVFYTRAVMPESMMLLCSIAGVYFFAEWIDRGRARDIFLSAICIAIAALLKITALYIGMPLLFLALRKYGPAFLRQPLPWVYAASLVLPVGLWYYHAHQLYRASGLSFGIWDYGSGKWGDFSPLLTFKFYNDVFFKSIAERHLTYPGFILFVVGLFVHRNRKEEKLFDWWLIGVMVFFAIVARGNQVHEYYQLPFTIPAAVFIGKALNKFLTPDAFRLTWKKSRLSLIAILLCGLSIPALGFLRYSNYMEGERLDGSIFQLGNAVRTRTEPDAFILAVDEGDPVVLYRCGRRGWHESPDNLTPGRLKGMREQGAQYLVGTTDFFDNDERMLKLQTVLAQFPVVDRSETYFILDLRR